MKKNKEDGMRDLEIIKIELSDCEQIKVATNMLFGHLAGYFNGPKCLQVIDDAATRMAAEIERLKAALAEKPDIVRCWECKFCQRDSLEYNLCHKSYVARHVFRNDFCSEGRRKEAKDED